MQTYDTTFPETLKMVEDAVVDMKEDLYDKGELDLVGVGMLRLNLEGNYEFEPHQHGIVSPETYGLTHVSLNSFAKGIGSSERQSDKYTFSISKRIVNYAAAAVVSAFFFLGWATPMQHNSADLGRQQAQVLGNGFNWGKSDAQNTTKAIATAPKKAEKTVSAVTPSPIPTTAPATVSPAKTATTENALPAKADVSDKGGYTIVVSCGLPQKYADRLISNLQEDGLNEARTEAQGKYLNVVYGNFATKSDAETFLKQLAGNERFKHAHIKSQAD